MPIIPKVGNKSVGVILTYAVMYALLTLGTVTMVYPLALMVSNSLKSGVDRKQHDMIPRYIYDDDVLFLKYLEDKFDGLPYVRDRYRANLLRFEDLLSADNVDIHVKTDTPSAAAILNDWEEFKRGLPPRYLHCVFRLSNVRDKARGIVTDLYRDHLRRKFSGDIKRYNAEFGEERTSFERIELPAERYAYRDWVPEPSPKFLDFLRFKAGLPLRYVTVVQLEPKYHKWLAARFDSSIDELNKALGASYASFFEIDLAPTVPAGHVEAKLWTRFIRNRWPFAYVDPAGTDQEWRAFLRTKYDTEIQKLNASHGRDYASFDTVALPDVTHLRDAVLVDWSRFFSKPGRLPAEKIRIVTARHRYAAFLQEKYGDVSRLNAAYGTAYSSLGEAHFPFLPADRKDFLDRKGEIRRDFLTRNYRAVIGHILLQGRAIPNTLILVGISIFVALTVNPMCAYALSRFNLPYAYRILMYCLATMAFPVQVAMIPNFLLLRDLKLLNTFLALFLPGMANGYSIFLLKGFFDTLPKQLYEAAELDGAGEIRMFWQFTLLLSKPVLAVIALNAFTLAYGGFMWAFLVCQDENMWTLMVWLYQMHQWSPEYVMTAGLCIAAIPTLLVFIFCQRIIMRGIVVPQMY